MANDRRWQHQNTQQWVSDLALQGETVSICGDIVKEDKMLLKKRHVGWVVLTG